MANLIKEMPLVGLIVLSIVILAGNVVMAQEGLAPPEGTEPTMSISVENAPQYVLDAFAKHGRHPDSGTILIYGAETQAFSTSSETEEVTATAIVGMEGRVCLFCWKDFCIACAEIKVR